MTKLLSTIGLVLVAGCTPQTTSTEFRAYPPAVQALPVGLSTTVPVPWTDFITPNVTFEYRPNQVYEIWVKPGQASVLSFPNDEFITAKSVEDPAHWFLSQAQPNHYTPTDHRLAVLASDPNKSTMLDVFTETRHYRVRLKSIDGTAFNETVDWQLPQPEVQVASADPFLPASIPSSGSYQTADNAPQSLRPLIPTGDELAETQVLTPSLREEVVAVTQSPVWDVREGQTLGQVLNEWTVQAGYRLLPMPEQSWRLGVSDEFTGEFEEALEWLLSGFAHANTRPVAIVHSNRVIEIKEEQK